MQRWFVTCFRDVGTHVIVVFRMLHSSNQHFLCAPELIVDHKTQTNVRFKSLTIVVDYVIGFIPQRRRGTRKSSLHNLLSELLTQWNAAGCKTLNNDHYVYTYYQGLSAFRVLLLYDWLYKRLVLSFIAISFQGNFQWTKLKWYNSFWNLVVTIVDQRNIHCNCYIKNFQVWETIAVIISIFQTTCVFLQENMAIAV